MKELNQYVYFYQIAINTDGEEFIVYDRTFPRSKYGIEAASCRMQTLSSKKIESFYTIGDTFKGAFY